MECEQNEDEEVIMATETVDFLCSTYPGRSKQIELLYNLLGRVGDPLPSSIYIFGDAATGKTKVVEALLNLVCSHFALINCIECYTPRLLLEPILDKVLDKKYSSDPDSEKCDNMMVFVKQLRIAAHKGVFDDATCIIALDNCERLFELGEHYFQAFQKLQELTSLNNLCVIFISQILPEKYPTEVPYIRVLFPQYSKDDVLNILKREMPQNEGEEALFNNFITFFLDTFYLATRDLNELKHQMNVLFPKYMEPVRAGRIDATNTVALYKHIAPHVKASVNCVYLAGTGNDDEVGVKADTLLSTKVVKSLDLPYYAKYFLIAAFLASYNSPKEDRRLYLKNHGKKRKRLVQDHKKENASKEWLGPKTFTLDRLLAIFYAIMEEKTALNANLLAQISTLVELRLMARLGEDLDKPKYKCSVGIDCVESVARTLDFNVRKYMVH